MQIGPIQQTTQLQKFGDAPNPEVSNSGNISTPLVHKKAG